MASSSSQRRCVFVGNIPYDATEEQLVQICEEVGPVVSFRLVIDRETGKPKGYGFCEYKDEETALSARRNLQGYEINGRQLRVDFAENDKNVDRNKEQGHGGPGMVANVGGPATVGDSGVHQPIGLQVAMAAASIMAGVLGGAQTGRGLSQNGLQGQRGLFNDPLTLHLAKISRNQLNEIMRELKVMAMQNKEQARQLLLTSPHLPKALFQAQIMLGMVTPQMLQMPNSLQPSLLAPSVSYDNQQGQLPVLQPLVGPHHLAQIMQNKMQHGLVPMVSESTVPAVRPNLLAHSQFSALPQLPMQPQVQLPQVSQSLALGQGILPGYSGISTIPSMRPLHLGTGPATSQIQPGSSVLSAISDNASKHADRPAPVTNASAGINRGHTYSGLPSGSSDKAKLVIDTPDPLSRPSKLVKLDDRGTTFSAAGVHVSTSLSRSSHASGPALSTKEIPKAEEAPAEKQVPQLQIPPEVESALLQQVLSLTPEQLSSLPPDQREQVIQLQQMLR